MLIYANIIRVDLTFGTSSNKRVKRIERGGEERKPEGE